MSIRHPLLVLAALAGLLALPGCGDKSQHPSLAVRDTEVIVRLPILTPQPTATPAPATPRPTETPAPTPTPLIHTVVAGDNLWDLSRRYGVSVSALQEANAILDPRRLQLGQELIIVQPEAGEEESIPTPTPLAFAVRGLTFHRTLVGSLWCLGEVWNTTGTTLEEVQIQITLRDAEGRVLASGQGVPALDAVAARQRVPFALLFRNPPEAFARYQARPLRGIAAVPGSRRYTDLTVIEDRGQMQGDQFLLQGQVRNTGKVTATVKLAVTVYDVEGDVVGMRSHCLPVSLAPGAQSPFTMTLLPVSQPVFSYAVQSQGVEVK